MKNLLPLLGLLLSLAPVTAAAGGADASELEGDWVGSLLNADAETTGAVALVLEQDSNRRASGPLALGLPGFEGVEFGDLDLTISGSGVVSGVAHSELVAYDDVEVQAQLIIHGEYLEDTGAIIADATLHLAGLGGETLTDTDYQKYFAGYDPKVQFSGRLSSPDIGGLLDGLDLGGMMDDLDLSGAFDGFDIGGILDDFDMGREYLIDRSLGGYFGGHDMGEYFGAQSVRWEDLGQAFGGHDMGEYFGGHDMGEYFMPELFGGHDMGEYFGGHDMGEYLTGSFMKRFGAQTPPSVELSEGGSVSFVLLLVPSEG